MIGLMYLKIKRNWRSWRRISMFNIQQPFLVKRLQKSKKAKDVIVSLTVKESRLKSFNLTLKSILAGKVLPEGIYIYLDEKTFEKAKNENSFLKQLMDLGFVHLRKVEDFRSYNKLIYALVEHPQKYIVVCDDDILYPKYWLLSLLKTHQKYNDPKLIVCHRAHKIIFEKDGNFSPYNSWEQEVKYENKKSINIFPTGMGGVLYPPNSMPDITKDAKLFQKLAPSADDIWFWFCAIYNKCSFVLTDKDYHPNDFLEIPNSQEVSLWKTNVKQRANDTQLKNTLGYFNQMFDFNLNTIPLDEISGSVKLTGEQANKV